MWLDGHMQLQHAGLDICLATWTTARSGKRSLLVWAPKASSLLLLHSTIHSVLSRLCCVSTLPSSPLAPQEQFIINKERSADMYRLLAYFLSHGISDLPMEWLLPTVYTAITYFMVALKPTAGAFFATLGTLYLDVAAAQVHASGSHAIARMTAVAHGRNS